MQRLVQRNVNYRTNLSKRARRERIREKGGPCASEINIKTVGILITDTRGPRDLLVLRRPKLQSAPFLAPRMSFIVPQASRPCFLLHSPPRPSIPVTRA